MTCRKCEKDIPDTSAYCLHCGANQSPKRSKRTRGNGEGTVYKLPSGKYQLEIRQPERRTKGGFATKKEAWAYKPTLEMLPLKAERVEKERREAERRARDRSSDTFAQLYEPWLKRHGNRVKAHTLYCYKAAYKYYADIHDIPFKILNTEDFQLCVDDCPKGKRTKENMKALGTLLYKYADELNITSKNYAQHIYIGNIETESRNAFPDDVLEKLLDAAKKGIPYADHVVCMCYLGYRPSELLDLTGDQYIEPLKAFRGGIKTEAGRKRIVPVSPIIQPMIDTRLECGNTFVFADENGQHLDERRFREECFYPLLAKLGIQPMPYTDGKTPKPIYTPYSGRHKFSMLLKKAKGDPRDKATLMGHTSYKVTMSYQEDDFDAMRAIVDSFGAEETTDEENSTTNKLPIPLDTSISSEIAKSPEHQ